MEIIGDLFYRGHRIHDHFQVGQPFAVKERIRATDTFEAGQGLCNLVSMFKYRTLRFLAKWLPCQDGLSPEVTNFHPLACARSGANMERTWKLSEVRQCGVPGLFKMQRGEGR